jgi:hypothetical protein
MGEVEIISYGKIRKKKKNLSVTTYWAAGLWGGRQREMEGDGAVLVRSPGAMVLHFSL